MSANVEFPPLKLLSCCTPGYKNTLQHTSIYFFKIKIYILGSSSITLNYYDRKDIFICYAYKNTGYNCLEKKTWKRQMSSGNILQHYDWLAHGQLLEHQLKDAIDKSPLFPSNVNGFGHSCDNILLDLITERHEYIYAKWVDKSDKASLTTGRATPKDARPLQVLLDRNGRGVMEKNRGCVLLLFWQLRVFWCYDHFTDLSYSRGTHSRNTLIK